MRHPLTAAIPAILLVLTACGSDTLTGPSSDSPLKNGPSTSLPTGTGNGGGVSASGSATNPNGDPTLNAKDESGSVTGGLAGGPSVGGSSLSGGSSSTGGTGGSSSNGGAGNGGIVSNGLGVSGSFEVIVPGSTRIVAFRESPVPAAAGGICGRDSDNEPNGTWIKTTDGTTSTHLLHTHCVIRETTAPTTITVTVADRANYVQTPGGNIALNLSSTCPVGSSELSCADRFVHYNANGDVTTGSGLLTGLGSDGSVWTIDLSQIQHSGNWRSATADGIAPAYRSYTALVATSNTGLTANVAQFAW
jgi:hypothetical protein